MSLDDYVPGGGDVDLLVVVGDPEHAELTLLTTCRVWRCAEERRHRDPTRLIDASQVRGPLEPSRPLLGLRAGRAGTGGGCMLG